MSKQILIVDDDVHVRQVEAHVLQQAGYRCQQACDVLEALERLCHDHFDVALIDIHMPGQSGLELVKRIRREFPATAPVMVTGVDNCEVASSALANGAMGYVVKPFRPSDLLIHVTSAMMRHEQENDLQSRCAVLEGTVAERTSSLQLAIQQITDIKHHLQASQVDALIRLARAAEYRDDESGHHIERVSLYSEMIARRLGLPDHECELIKTSSILHDVGKIAIEDRILYKPGSLTPEEFEKIKTHTLIGHELLSGSDSPILQLGAQIALCHHERHDGTGYPRGIGGHSIPLPARIVAIADTFDAMTHDRVYSHAIPFHRAIGIMQAGRGYYFDPELLDLFLEAPDALDEIRRIFPQNRMPTRAS